MKAVTNLIDLDKPLKEEFAKIEVGTDCSFYNLPEKAQEVAESIIKEFKTYNAIKRELDRSLEFRGAFKERLAHKEIDVFDMDFTLQAVDSVMRYWSWKFNGEIVV